MEGRDMDEGKEEGDRYGWRGEIWMKEKKRGKGERERG